jgi:DNA-binding PadR family transcriptional regulator
MLEDPTGDHYGLALSHVAELPSGTIYPMLRRLEEQRWLTSRWEDVDPREVGRPRKRLYRLTGTGAREARRELESARRQLVLAIPKLMPAAGGA